MPRKKELPKFKYTIRKDGILYVKYPLPGEKYPIWRKCENETQDGVNEIISQIKTEKALMRAAQESRRANLSLSQFLDEWLDAARQSLAKRTADDYGELHARYIKDTIGKILLAEISTLDAQRLITSLTKKGLSASVVRRVHVLLSSALKQAVVWNKIEKNPAVGILLPKLDESETQAMTRTEAKSFIEACRKSPEYLVLEFALETGLRPEEYLALTWKEIDFEARTVRVIRAVSFARKGGGFEFVPPKTKQSRRTVTFSEKLKERLVEHRERRRKQIEVVRKRAKGKVQDKPVWAKGVNFQKRIQARKNAAEKLKTFETYNLVFPAANGAPRSIGNLGRREFKAALKNAGLPPEKFSLYSLRHTNASLLVERFNPKRLQKWLGHASLTTTLKYYVHVNEDSPDEMSRALSEMLY